MPIASSGAASEYIHRQRICVDPDQRDRVRSKSQFSFVLPLEASLEYVVGCELVDYNVRSSLQQTFFAAEPGFPGNNMIDVHMEDAATNAEVLDFTVVIPPGTALTAANLTTLFNDQMDAQADIFHNTANDVVWAITQEAELNSLNQDNAFQFLVQENGGADTIEATFLFSSGANSANSAAAVLGFDQADTTGTVPIPPYQPNTTPFRYLEVRIAEFRELDPVGVIFLTDDASYSLSREGMTRARLLQEPERFLRELRVELTLPDGRTPNPAVISGVDLVLELLVLAPEPAIPRWVQQQFQL